MGGLGAIPATPRNLIYLYETAKDQIADFNWSICAAGRTQLLCTIAAAMGGNVRAGLEDNLYLKKGVLAKSNAEQVEKIIKIIRELDLEPATPEEAREIRLKGADKVNFYCNEKAQAVLFYLCFFHSIQKHRLTLISCLFSLISVVNHIQFI